MSLPPPLIYQTVDSYEPVTPLTPSNRWSAPVCWVLVAALVIAGLTLSTIRQKRLATEPAGGPPGIQMLAAAKYAVAARYWALSPETPQVHQTYRKSVDDAAHSPDDQLAAAVITAELDGRPAALRRLQSLPVAKDVETARTTRALERLYSDPPSPPTVADRDLLTDRLGWFGQLALTQQAPETDPIRGAVLRSASHAAIGLIAVSLVGIAAALLGVAGAITLLVMLGLGKLPKKVYDPTGVQPPRLLHVFVLWALGWIGTSAVVRLLNLDVPVLALEAVIATLTFAVLFWPVFRGDSWGAVRRAIGLHTGTGVFTEIGCGVAGYLCGMPLLIAGFTAMFLLGKWAHVTGEHPITQDLPTHFTAHTILALYLTASVLAPILEETVFRGALYGHLRRGHSTALSAVITAFVFASIHPQGWTAIPALGAIAVVLALLREWRGSLIAPMTAHAVNNGFVVTLLIVIAN